MPNTIVRVPKGTDNAQKEIQIFLVASIMGTIGTSLNRVSLGKRFFEILK